MYLFDHSVPPIESFSGEHRFLSNFFFDGHFSIILINCGQFWTSEAAYMYHKVKDVNAKKSILVNSNKPALCKRIGNEFPVSENWCDPVRINTMTKILEQKFSYEHMKEMLLSTGERELIEGNTWNDTFWGVCKGKGQNHLGKILMEIRETLR